MTIRRDWHWTDEPGPQPGARRRTIRNWTNYRDTRGRWAETQLRVRRAEADDEFLGRALDWVSTNAPLQFFIGDAVAAGGRPWWGVRRSEDSDTGVAMFLESGDASGGYTVDPVAKSLTWEDVLPDTDLILYAGVNRIDKWLALHTATSGEGGTGDRAVLGFVLPSGWSLDVESSGVPGNHLVIKRANGSEVYRSRPAAAFDSSAIPQAVPCTFIRPSPATGTLGGLTYYRVRVRCLPAGFVRPILMDPTIVISGTAAIDDAAWNNANPTWNMGIYSYVLCGSQSPNYRHGGVMRFSTILLPAGTVISAVLSAYRTGYTSNDYTNGACYPVAAGNTWVEGTTQYTPQVGSSCFQQARYAQQDWLGGANGCEVINTDTITGELPSWEEYGTYAPGDGWMSIQITSAWVMKWKSGEWVNNGVVFRRKQDAFTNLCRASTFYSADGATAWARPYLTLDYTTGLLHESSSPYSPRAARHRPVRRPAKDWRQ